LFLDYDTHGVQGKKWKNGGKSKKDGEKTKKVVDITKV